MCGSSTRDDRIFSEIEEIAVVLRLLLHLLLWLSHHLLMIALICDRIDIVVHEPLSLEEVFPPLLLLYLLLALVEGECLLLVLSLDHVSLFELLEELDQLSGRELEGREVLPVVS